MEAKQTIKFKTGEEITGVVVAQALVIMLVRVGNAHYLVNRTSILDDGSDEMEKEETED